MELMVMKSEMSEGNEMLDNYGKRRKLMDDRETRLVTNSRMMNEILMTVEVEDNGTVMMMGVRNNCGDRVADFDIDLDNCID